MTLSPFMVEPHESLVEREAIASRSDRWYAACLKITRNQALAEDAVQEALVSAWAKREQFQQSAKLETWIHRIAVNAALQLLRKHRPGVFEPLEVDIADQSNSPEANQHEHDLGDRESEMLVLEERENRHREQRHHLQYI